MVHRKIYKAKYVSKTTVSLNSYLLTNTKMVIIGNQITFLFEYGNLIEIENRTRILFQEE